MTTNTEANHPGGVHRGRVLLFPTCDRDGVLSSALSLAADEPATRADAMLFGWMLGLDAAVDAVGAARAVLAVAARQPNQPATAYRQALINGLERFVADQGRVASLSARPSDGAVRRRRRWRDAPKNSHNERDRDSVTRA